MAAGALRIGIVGAGANTRRHHIPKLKAIAGVEIVSVANRSARSAQRAATEFGIPTVYEDWRALVGAEDTDAIVIGTWPYMHCPVTLAALAAGKHVLTEARMASNADEARRMLAASRDRPDLTCMVVPSPFTFAVDDAVIARIRGGYLGEIVGIHLNGIIPGFADFDGPYAWRNNRDFSGWNVLTLGIWYEGLMRWVGEATRVMARARTVVRQRIDRETGEPRQVTVPDHVEVIADMACGAIARFSFSAVTGFAPSQQVWLYGAEGTLCYDHGAQVLLGGRRTDPALTEIEIPETQRGFWRVEEEFVNAVRGIEPVRRTTFVDGVRYMEFTEAVGRSAATGSAIALPFV